MIADDDKMEIRESLETENVELAIACQRLHSEVARLTDELAKRDKGIERMRRRRGELVEQVRELTDRVAQLESGQRTAPRAHTVASNDVEIYRAKLGRVLDAIHEIEREVRSDG